MNELDFLSVANIVMGLLFLGLGLPMIFRKIPMNRIYGVRFSLTFKSDQNWYDINEAGGKILAGWSLPLIAFGFYAFFRQPENLVTYSLVSTALTIGACVAMCVHTYIVAKRIDKRNHHSSL